MLVGFARKHDDIWLRLLGNFSLKAKSFDPALPANQFADGKSVLGGFAVSGYSGRTFRTTS